MSEFKAPFNIVNPDDPPCVDVHYEWGQYALWVSGRYGYQFLDGHEIGLSADLVQDLQAWCDAADALFDSNDPENSLAPDNFLEDCLELAKRVRAELPAEWIVTCYHPELRHQVEL